jgi:hypothetical protein
LPGYPSTTGKLNDILTVTTDGGPPTWQPVSGGTIDPAVWQAKSEKNQPSGYVGLDASSNINLVAAAQVYWGGDTSVYRSSAGVLKTDGTMRVGQYFDVAFSDTGQLRFGSLVDTNLYRAGPSNLKTDGRLDVGADLTSAANLWARYGAAIQVRIGYVGSGVSGLEFGSAADTNLYRSAANSLKTDGNLTVGAGVGVVGGVTVSGDPGTAGYTSLYLLVSGTGSRQVAVGAPDSGGTGARALIVPN